jgi:hypothetical protein
MTHAPDCTRGYHLTDTTGVTAWRGGQAPPGTRQWHTATCEGPDANAIYAGLRGGGLRYARAMANILYPDAQH